MRFAALLISAVLCAFGSFAEATENRVALVVGNATYKEAPHLPTPLNDAEDIANVLTASGFDVILQRDATAESLRRALTEFSQKAGKAEVAIAYFAGYSVNVGVDSFLVPVDAELSMPAFRGVVVPLGAVTREVAKAKTIGLVILDALRKGPYPAKIDNRIETNTDKPDSNGAAAGPTERSDAFHNVLILFANAPTQSSEETGGRNSPLAAALLKYLPEPDLEISFLFRNVRDDVRNSTRTKQTPYMYGQLSSAKIFLNPVKQATLSIPSVDPSTAQACDDLAAAPEDKSRSAAVKGVTLDEIKSAEAISACSEAVKRFPGVNRFHYQLGRSLFAARDYPAALTSFKKAFELGSTLALYTLGSMYEHGNGVEADPIRARFYYEIAAEQKYAPAIVSLGTQHERGLGVDKDPSKAYSYYQRAADLGNAQAYNAMGELAEKGQGVAPNPQQARAFYDKGSKMGDPDATINLARCYANGIGGRKDIPEAKKLLAQAAQAGSQKARAILASTEKPKRP